MAEEVVPGVWWLHGTRGSNVFLAETASGALALFDTGFGGSFEGIVADVESIRPGSRLTHVFLTHHHVDHVGAALALRLHYGALVVAGSGDCGTDHEDGGYLLEPHLGPSHYLRRFVRPVTGGHSPRRVVVDQPLVGEVEIAGVLAIPTPGHTPGSYCYLLPDRDLAIMGDLVLGNRRGISRPMRTANHDDVQYLRSLEMFAHRAPDRGCPGHGPVIERDLGKQLLLLTTMERDRGFSPARLRRRARRLGAFGWSMMRGRPRR